MAKRPPPVIPGLPAGAGAPGAPGLLDATAAAEDTAEGLAEVAPKKKRAGHAMVHAAVLNPDIIREIGAAIELGVPQTAAAAAQGVTAKRWHKWVVQGRQLWLQLEEAADAGLPEPALKPGQELAVLAYATRSQCEARCIVRKVAKVEQDPHWTAAMTWLERRMPRLFAHRSRHEISGVNGKPIEHMATPGQVSFDDVIGLVEANRLGPGAGSSGPEPLH